MLSKTANCKTTKQSVLSIIHKTLHQQYHCTLLIKRQPAIANCIVSQSCYKLLPHVHTRYYSHSQPQKLPSIISPPSSTDSEPHQIHVKGLQGRHYTHDCCYVCNKQLSASNPHNLIAHLNGTKHIKNVLSEYSGDYQQHCIYCNVACHTAEARQIHVSSLQHAAFINGIIDEIKNNYPDRKSCVFSIADCQSRAKNSISDLNGSIRSTKKSGSTATVSESAVKIRKAISDCYEHHDTESIQEQLSLLQRLPQRCRTQISEKDHISILYVLSSLMRTNDVELIEDGIIKICKLFSEDIDTLQPSKWKMNHKLFEQMVDIMILSVNLQQRIEDFLTLSEQHDERHALRTCLGIEDEKKFLQPFSMFFAFFNDITKWTQQCFENEEAQQYFMKWTQLIFQDMMYSLRDVRTCKQPNFDFIYHQLLKPYIALYGLDQMNLDDPLQRRKLCAFEESKRLSNTGPLTNVVLRTALDCTLSQFGKGSFVLLYPEEAETNHIDPTRLMIGYLYKLSPTAQTVNIQIANHSENIPSHCKWHLLSLSGSSASFEAQFEALQRICGGAVAPQLTSMLYNHKDEDKSEEKPQETQIKLYETELVSQLNNSQRIAVEHALNNSITLIQGPPGTGKTHVAAAIVEQFLKHYTQTKPTSHRPKILLSAFSNIAVDVLTERVMQHNLYPLRLGAETTLPADSRALLSSYPAQEWASRIAWAEIICATSIGSANQVLKNVQFDMVLIDETTQSTESGLLVALSKLKHDGKVVLIGDHKQLPPTVLSKHANDNGLGVSLFERLIEERGIKPLFLATQYRMHPKLAQFPSAYFYDGQLLSGVTENDRQIPNGFDWPRADFPIAFVQTDEDAKEEYRAVSAVNRREADIVGDIVVKLILQNEDHNVTVIAPYAAQKQLIHDNLFVTLNYDERKRVKVRTVDGFQGSECDIIVFTATRSNEENMIGFLQDQRRVNVMLTRTRSGLIVVGDRETLSNGDVLWRSWLKYVCDDHNAIVYDYKLN